MVVCVYSPFTVDSSTIGCVTSLELSITMIYKIHTETTTTRGENAKSASILLFGFPQTIFPLVTISRAHNSPYGTEIEVAGE